MGGGEDGEWGGINSEGSMIHLYCGLFCGYGSNYMQRRGVGGCGGTWVIRLALLG